MIYALPIFSFLATFVGYIWYNLPPESSIDSIVMERSLPVTFPIKDPFIDPTTLYLRTGSDETSACQDLIIEPKTGDIYGGMNNGSIFRIKNHNPSTLQIVAQSSGMILGVELSLDGKSILFMDSTGPGLCKMDLQSFKIQHLLSEADQKIFSTQTLNSLAQAKDGTIYFTVSSNQFTLIDYAKSLTRATPTGQLYSYDPKTKQINKIFSGLGFANGIVLDENEQSAIISQSSRLRLSRVWLKGERKGSSEIFIENLPGFPDNLNLNKDGNLWVAIVAWRNPLYEYIFKTKFFRRVCIALDIQYIFSQAADVKYSGGFLINMKTKQITHQLFGKKNKLMQFGTTITQFGDKIYISSRKFPNIVVVNSEFVTEYQLNPEEQTQNNDL